MATAPAPNAAPRSRCGACGLRYNPYGWAGCPCCEADRRGQFALGCCSCRTRFFGEREDFCPECGSGETTVFATPEQPAVR